MNHHRCAQSLAAGLALLSLLPAVSAQTVTWTGSSALTTVENWNDGSRWDTGAPPNSPTSIAVINNTALATSYPSGGIQISSATVDLAELRLGTSVASNAESWAQRVVVTAPYALPPSGSTLNLYGAGITATSSSGTNPRYNISVGMGSQLHFYNSASISGANVAIGFDNANSGFSGSVDFHDQSSAGNSSFFLQGSGVGAVTFHNQSSAATASIEADDLTFADQSSADRARITTYAFGSTVLFKDQSSAANANIVLGRYGSVTFAGQSSGGNSTVSCSLESGGVIVREQADVSGLAVVSIRRPGETSLGGALDIENAAGNVTVRGIDGGIKIRLGANTLTLGTNVADQSLEGLITGTGGLVLDTGHAVRITRVDNSYTGPTTVRSGSLNLAGGRVSATSIATGAQLTGTGKVAGNLVNSGTISPGNSAGTIQVEGNLTMNPSGTLAIELVSPTDFDRLTIGGTATLGGTLNLTGSGTFPTVGNATLNFLSASAVSGRFDNVTTTPGLTSGLGAARSGQLIYSATGASYQITQAAFAGFGGTSPAATALGSYLDSTLVNSSGEFRSLLAGLNSLPTSANVGTALEALAPDRYSVLAENAFATASARRAATDRRLESVRSSSSPASAFFLEAGARSAAFDATGSSAKARSRLDHGTVGGIWHNEAISAGAFFSYETGHVDLDSNGSTDALRSITPELFFRYDTDLWFVNASIARSSDDHDLRRRIVYPGQNLTALASVAGSRMDLALTVGSTFTAGDWTISPVAGLQRSEFKVNDFVETDAVGANLAIAGWNNHSLRSHVGVEASRPGVKFTPNVAIRWLHEFKDNRSVPARFVGATGNSYIAPGRPAETDLVEASLSVSARLGSKTTGSLTLGGVWGRKSRITSDLTASISRQF